MSLRTAATLIVCTPLLPALIAAAEMPAESWSPPARYSLSEVPAAPSEAGFTLLDPTWLLPPIDSLEHVAQLSAAERADVFLHEDAIRQLGTRPLPRARPPGPVAYRLSDALTAHVRYRRSGVFGFSRSQAVRDDPSLGFLPQPDRDVVDLNMSWRLAGNTVGLGYQLQSSAHGFGGDDDGGLARFMPGSEQAMHSVSLGFTRHWGGSAPPPALPDLPLLLDEPLAAAPAASAESTTATASPTPAH